MTTTPAITIPSLENESQPAYQARVRYVVLGEQRSLDVVAQELHKSRSLLGRWSERHHWQEHARRYDELLASLAAQAHAEQYRKDLEEHRSRYQSAGRDLYNVAQGLMVLLAQSMRGRTIEGKDGKVYTIPTMEMTPNTLSIAARALTIAADLEAHALRIADVLPKLDVYDTE